MLAAAILFAYPLSAGAASAPGAERRLEELQIQRDLKQLQE